MMRQGLPLFTGRVRLYNGWELRPAAYRLKDGGFLPELAARPHQAGCPEAQVITLDQVCHSKEHAFELALTEGLKLAAAPLM